MRTLCDVCENAPAVVFCAADEAVLCRPCDDKVHMCNKLSSRHMRVGLANPSEVSRCDICENAPAFFYCEIDGTSLCLQCDTIVHVGGKRTHGRYLLLRQRVEFPGDKPGRIEDLSMQPKGQVDNRRNHVQDHAKIDKKIDLNTRPVRTHGLALNTQTQGADILSSNNHGAVPNPYERDANK